VDWNNLSIAENWKKIIYENTRQLKNSMHCRTQRIYEAKQLLWQNHAEINDKIEITTPQKCRNNSLFSPISNESSKIRTKFEK
jgi:hypothetical protein